MKFKMTKQSAILLSVFSVLFVLFASFQNFDSLSRAEKEFEELPEHTLKNAVGKIHGIQFFRPYFFREHIGNLETPIGYITFMHKKEGPVIFDDKKYLEDKFHSSPVYKETKDFFEISSSHENSEGAPCVRDPSERYNNCLANYNNSSDQGGSSSMRFHANPLRRLASVSYESNINSQLQLDEAQKSVNLEFSKKLNSNSNVNLEMKSQDQSGQINVNWTW